jgi:ribosomal protein S18 acetylase RimI-like enzyme
MGALARRSSCGIPDGAAYRPLGRTQRTGWVDRRRAGAVTAQVGIPAGARVDRRHAPRSDATMDLGGIRIRRAVSRDAAAIASIHTASWRDAYATLLDPAYLAGPIEDDRRALWADRLERPDPRRTTLLAEAADAAALGFGCVYRDLDPAWGSLIDNLHVVPRMRGRRIGVHLITAVARCAEGDAETRGIHLWVFEANEAAVRFYRRLGGDIVERDASQAPTSRGAAILRVFWPDVAVLAA